MITKKRAVAYARVSTDSNDQENSLKNQKEYWEDYIKSQPNLEYLGMYWDEGITGTSTVKRSGFTKMIADAFAGKFDLIYVKSISRFSRNTLDLLKFTRELRQRNVGVIFEKENINTLELSGEILITIFSSIAQEESRNISENVRFGHRQAMKNGIVFGNGNILGYDIIDKKLVINEKESEIVKAIFNWFVNEKESYRGIVRRLKDELGITHGKTGGIIQTSTIKNILENEKYCGDLKQQKYYTTDFLNRKQKKNKGEKEFYIIRDNHEPIIDRETWNEAQRLMKIRKQKYSQSIGYSKSCWGGKIFCGICGDKFRTRTITTTKTKFKVWLCNTNYDKGKKACNNGSYLREDFLETIFMWCLKQLANKEEAQNFINQYKQILANNIGKTNYKEKLNKLNNDLSKIIVKKDNLIELYEDSQLTKEDFNRRYESLNQKEIQIRDEIQNITNREQILNENKSKINKIFKLIDEIVNFEQFDRKYVDTFLEKIIKTGDKLEIILTFNQKYEFDLSNYPKRKSNQYYITVMDNIYKFPKGNKKYNVEISLLIA